MTKIFSSSTTTTKNDIPDDIYADAGDELYGLVRDPNFHDWEYCNRRRRCRFIDSCSDNDDDDCRFLDDPNTAVICLGPILPSPFRDLSYKPRSGWSYDPSTRNTIFFDRLGTAVSEPNFLAYRKRRPKKSNIEKNENDEENPLVLAAPLSKPCTKMIIPVSWKSNIYLGIDGNNKSHQHKNMIQSKRTRTASNGAHEIISETQKNRGKTSNSTIEGYLKPNKRQKLSGDNDIATVITNSTTGDTSCSSNLSNNNEATGRIVHSTEGNCKAKVKDSTISHVKGLPIISDTIATTPFVSTVTTITSSTIGLQKQQEGTFSETGNAATGLGSPKEALYQWYGKKPRKTQIKADQYMVWDNGKMNEQLFSAIFVCPLTSEAFLAGPWSKAGQGNVSSDVPGKDGLYWYPRKITAEHAAAARAWDCLMMREGGGVDSRRGRLGGLEPYWPSQRPMRPLKQIPSWILGRLLPEQIPNTSNADDVNKSKNGETVTTPKKSVEKVDTNFPSWTGENEKMEKNCSGVVGLSYEHSKNNFTKRETTSREGGRCRNNGGDYRRTRRTSSRNQNYVSHNYDDQKSKTRDVQHYNPYGQRSHFRQHDSNDKSQQKQLNIPKNIVPYHQQQMTHNQGQLMSTVFQFDQNQVSHGIQQPISKQNYFNFQQHAHKNQYLEQRPNSGHFQYAGNIHSFHNSQHTQQPILSPIPPPPPPPPPPSLGSSHNYSMAWCSQSFENKSRSQYF